MAQKIWGALILGLCIFAGEISSGETLELTGRIHWQEGVVEAIGQGLEPSDRLGTPRGKLMARRAAELDLKRELLRLIQGAHIDSVTTIKDMEREEHTSMLIGGVVGRVEILESSFEEGVHTLKGRVSLDSLRELALRRGPQHKARDGGAVESLVIDARSVQITPSITFRVFSEKGAEVYSLEQVNQSEFLYKGLCRYLDGQSDARGLSQLDHATYVTALGTKNNGVDLIISDEESRRIAGPQPFKRSCSVVVLMKNPYREVSQ